MRPNGEPAIMWFPNCCKKNVCFTFPKWEAKDFSERYASEGQKNIIIIYDRWPFFAINESQLFSSPQKLLQET